MRPVRRALAGFTGLAAIATAMTAPGCATAEAIDRAQDPHPLVVIGIDGADWRVVHHEWDKGGMPNLHALVARGASGPLTTGYGAKSPVVWTVVATGRNPEDNGIDDFVESQDDGAQVPVSGDLRRVKALWEMADQSGLRTALLGWWASWPAEPLKQGWVLSDRVHNEAIDHRMWPTNLPVDAWGKTALDHYAAEFPGDDYHAEGDRLYVEATQALWKGNPRPDLSMTYLRRVDLVSHGHWKYFEMAAFSPIAPDDMAKNGGAIFQAYEAVDRAVGDIVAAAPSDARVLVMSDHGFHAIPEQVRVRLNPMPVLGALGFAAGTGGKLDWEHTQVYVIDSPDQRFAKKLHFNVQGRDPQGIVASKDVAKLKAELTAALGRVTYAGTTIPVFTVRAPTAAEDGADLVAEVHSVSGATDVLQVDGKTIDDAVVSIAIGNGAHGQEPPGIFVLAGPDVRAGYTVQGATIHDIAPTLLYALGLPVGADMPGHPLLDVFDADFAARHPVAKIASWETEGVARSVNPPTTTQPGDDQLMEGLRSLGYIE